MPRIRIPTPKVVADPVYGITDIASVLPMVEKREFQALADKRQLGMSYLTFPSATHSRKAHSLGSYHATRELGDRWVKLKLVSNREADALAAFALYHDIGHPAFSHVTEDLSGLTNSASSLEIMKRSKAEVEACGVDFQLFMSIANGKNKLGEAVKDKNIGMEKLDYLERDGISTILSKPAGIDYLRSHIYFVRGKLVIDEKAVDVAIEVQNFYIRMYKNVYLRKSAVIGQRTMQKMVYLILASGDITRRDLIRLTDSELVGILRVSRDATIRRLYELLFARNLFRETIVLRDRAFSPKQSEISPKIVREFGLDQKIMNRLARARSLQPKNQKSLMEIEQRIASVADIPEAEVLLVPVFSPSRFAAEDITIYTRHGKFASLKALYPAHFKSMEETGRAYAAFRICTTETYRKRLSGKKIAERVFGLIMGSL